MGSPWTAAIRTAIVAFLTTWADVSRGDGGDSLSSADLEECVTNLPECIAVLSGAGGGGNTGVRRDEDLAFGILAAWLKDLYVREGANSLAENRELRAVTLGRLHALAAKSVEQPELAIGVGQMLFLYFWWGVSPPPPDDDDHVDGRSSADSRTMRGSGHTWRPTGVRQAGPDATIVEAAAQLHALSIEFAGCHSQATPIEVFVLKKCPWRWRFLLLLLTELGLKVAVEGRDVARAVRHLRVASEYQAMMRQLPFFIAQRGPHEGPHRANQNEDFLPHARQRPVWTREMWPPLAYFLEGHYHVFRGELDAILGVDQDDELFSTVQQQQTEFTRLPRDWAIVDLVRQGKPTAVCQYAPASCALLQQRPEVDGRCFSEDRVPNAGASFARLWPGAEIKPHFATEPRVATHLGLITPPGAKMVVGNESVDWAEGQVVVFDDTYMHTVRHNGQEPRYVLLLWACHPCDLEWRAGLPKAWKEEHPLPEWCTERGAPTVIGDVDETTRQGPT
eukprot:TRINITY_DN74130_c0_g1_i1.p1 TRINITY_DN74130_c0_g1~~TRINITY_DN74130_c0_g1_i1.p1  ORF type:complete len:506 (-),score=65.28 TRINITY_DN74130_c0_g1_i1:12-1529(-)